MKLWRRRRYFINQEFQGKYIFTFFLFILFGTILFSILLNYFSANTLTVVYDNYNLQIGSTPVILRNRYLSAHWLFIIIGSIVVVTFSLFLTHKIAGPLYKIELTFKKMCDGDFTNRIGLRRNDEAKELAMQVNNVNEKVRTLLQSIHDISVEIEHAVKEIDSKENDKEQIKQKITKLRNLEKKLRYLLLQYRW